MVATNQRKKKDDTTGSVKTTFLVAAAVVFIVIFVIGLNWGGGTERKKSVVTANELHHREEALREQMSECKQRQQEVIQTADSLDSAAGDLKDRNKKLDSRNKELYREHSQQEAEIAKCQEETETQVAMATEADESRKKTLAVLHEEVEQLRQAFSDMTNGHGMRTVMLASALEKMKTSYARVHKLVADGDPESDKTPFLDSDAILKKHKAEVKELDARLEAKQKEVEDVVTNWTHWRYDPLNHTDIFLDTVDSDGEVIRPSYFGRTGSPPVALGMRLRVPRTFATSSLSKQFVGLYDFALCAMRNNNSNFTYPNVFYWHYRVESDRSFLNLIIDTPLLTFCDSCSNHRRSLEFYVACKDDSSAEHYGGLDFWRARTHIRFQPHITHEADNFIFANNLKGKKYLAVVFHSSSETIRYCERQVRSGPAPHYLYVRGNFDEEAPPMNRDVDLQCSPTWPMIATRINSVLKAEEEPFDAVYLSIEPEAMDHVKHEDLPGVSVVMMDQKSATDEAVDIDVASRATKILVSAFLPQSQIVTEEFLMRHQLTANKNILFF